MKRIRELDGLRALAIFAVMLTHFRPTYSSRFNFMALGWSGVDLFFAISGFLITSILIDLRGKEHPYKTFYWRRALRIFPPYYAALGAILLLAVIHGETVTRNEMIAAWVFVSSIARGYSIPLIVHRIFLHASFITTPQTIIQYDLDEFRYAIGIFWSLSAEELFYLLWAPIILRGSRRTILSCSIAPIFLSPVLRGLTHTSGYSEAFSFPCRFDALAAGGCLALLMLAVKRGHLSARLLDRGLLTTLPISLIALILLSWHSGAFRGIEIRSTTVFSVLGYTLLAILCTSVVGVCARWAGSTWMTALRLKPITYVGTISYMVYLIHIPVYVAIGIVLGRNSHHQIEQAILGVLCTIAIAGLSWKYVESPILTLKTRQIQIVSALAVPVAPAGN
jgi:peptidoglycan/LPS O-acetylase OafA/YrhL